MIFKGQGKRGDKILTIAYPLFYVITVLLIVNLAATVSLGNGVYRISLSSEG